MTAVVANGIRDVEREVVTAFDSRNTQQLTILSLTQVFLEVAVQCRTTGEVLNILTAVETETIENVQTRIFYYVEIAVVAVARNNITVFLVPFRMFYTYVLCRNHLAVEHNVFRAELFVLFLDDTEHFLNKVRIFGAIFYLYAQELCCFYQSVNTNRQVLTANVDITGVKQRKHATILQRLQVLVVSQLHFMHQVNDILNICLIRDVVANSILNSTVQVDCQYRFRTGRHTTCAQRVTEAVVCNLVTQAAATRQTVGVVAHIREERVTFRVHLGREIAVLFVFDIAVLCQQSHRLYRERQHATRTLFVEPVHETTLQPVQTLPVRSLTVRETEVLKQTLEIITVVVTDVPEYGLEVTRTARLIQTVHYLLEAVGNNLVNRATFQTHVYYFVGAFVVIVTVFLLNEIVHIHKELRRSARTRKHGRNHEHHVDEAAAERFQVVRRSCVTADTLRSADEPRIHRDRSTVVSQVRLIVLVDEMLIEQAHVTVAQLFAEHLFDTLGQQTTVQTNETLFRQLADKRRNVLVLHVRVRVKLRTFCGIARLHIIHHKVQTTLRVAVLRVLMAIQHVCFRYLVITFCHKCYLYLVLNLLHGSVVMNSQMREDGCHRFIGRKCTYC